MCFYSFLVFTLLLLGSDAGVEFKIVGGRKSLPKEFPSIVYLEYTVSKSQFCGGTIIDETHVVTAAHCFLLIPIMIAHAFLINVVAGDLKSQKKGPNPNRQIIPVKKIVLHPGFHLSNFKRDLAIMSLVKAIQVTKFVAPAPLATISPKIGSTCYVAGWGVTLEGGKPSPVLLVADVTINRPSYCASTNKNGAALLDDFQLCAGDLSGEKDACQGDSGGPLYCDNKLAGIVSYGIGCARPNTSGTYTNVAKSLQWIKKLKEMSNKRHSILQNVM